MARITLIQGHPDARGGHLCHALAGAYAEGAASGGHETHTIDVAALSFPLLRTAEDFYRGQPPAGIAAAQQAIAWAGHLVIIHPLWLGHPPAMLHAFLEQAFRPGFAVAEGKPGRPRKLLAGRSARVVITMGMPGWFYRAWYGAHALKALQRNVLGFCGVAPVRATLIGLVGAGADIPEVQKDYVMTRTRERLAREVDRLRELGRRAL